MLRSIAAVEYICDVPMRSDVKMEIFVSPFKFQESQGLAQHTAFCSV